MALVHNAQQEKKVAEILKNIRTYKGEMGFALKEWLLILNSKCEDFGLPNHLRSVVVNRAIDDQLTMWWKGLPAARRDTYEHQVESLMEQFCPPHQYQLNLRQYLDETKQKRGERVANFVSCMGRVFDEFSTPLTDRQKREIVEDKLLDDIKKALEGRIFTTMGGLVRSAEAVEAKRERGSEQKKFLC